MNQTHLFFFIAALVCALFAARPVAAQDISEDSLRRAPAFARYADLYRNPLAVLKLEVSTGGRVPETIDTARNLRALTIRGGDYPNTELIQLPFAVYNLIYLERLTIENTGLRKLAPEIGNLKRLRYLNVRKNPDLARLPEAVGNLPELRALVAGETPLPNNLSECASLRRLETASDDFPPLPQLETLVYSGRKVPGALGASANLKSATFTHPEINLSSVFDFLLECDSLEHVAFHAEAADRRAWEKLSRMTTVTHLEVVAPKGLPADVTDLTLLRRVTLKDIFCLQEKPCGYIFDPLVQMDFLETLTLNNYATDIRRLKNLRRVEILNSADLNVLDFEALRKQLAALPKLDSLNLMGTKLDRAQNVRFDGLKRLRYLNLAYTGLPEDGEIWNSLHDLDSLKTLALSTDDLGAGKLAPALLEMKQLEKLVVYNRRPENKLLLLDQQKAVVRKSLPDCEVVFYQ